MMKVRLIAFLVALLIVSLLIWLNLRTPKPVPSFKEVPSAQIPPKTAPFAISPPTPVLAPAASEPPLARADTEENPVAALLNRDGGTAEEDVQTLRALLAQFLTALPARLRPPLGDNQDIAAALTGDNREQLLFLPANHRALDAQKRLLDRWGTPYWFHAQSADSFDIRSAGPDKKLFTADDVALEWSGEPKP